MALTLLHVALTASLTLGPDPFGPAEARKKKDGPQPPPGMVFLKKERVKVGLDEDAAKELILESNGEATHLWDQTPQWTATVDDFYLMATEVTHEQFAEYVSASNSQPPEMWGKAAIDEARRAFLKEQGEAREAAREAGQPLPPKQTVASDEWWRLNWQDNEWEVPKEVAELPVTEVSYDQAKAYARWAGLRLPTEVEFQRAVRGKTENQFPWGESWDPKRAYWAENSKDRLWPVGNLKEGASPEGVYDLLGSVWEWTSSEYVPYPKYKPQTLKVKSSSGSHTAELMVEWDPAKRVTVGGSFKNPAIALRCTSRAPTEPWQTTNALGFRCAASPTIGYDMAQLVEREDVARHIRSDHEFDLSLTVAMDRWKWRKGEAGKRLESYAVITDYDYLLFAPIAEAGSSNTTVLGKQSIEEGPVVLGFLSSTLQLSKPALEPGTYVVGYRAKGKIPKRKKPEEGEEGAEGGSQVFLEEVIEFDPDVDNLVFMDRNGTPVQAVPFKGVESQRLRAGAIAVSEVAADARKEIAAHEKIVISAAVPTGRRGLLFDIVLECEPGTATGDWRK